MKKATTSIDKQDFVSRNLIITGRTRHRPTLRAPTSEPMSNPGWRRAESFDLRYAIGHAVIRAVCKITLLIELCTQPRVHFVVVIPCVQFSRPELEHDDGRAKFRSRHLWSSLLSPQPLGMTCSCTVAVFVGELSRQQTRNDDGSANNVARLLSDIKSLRPAPVLYADEQSNPNDLWRIKQNVRHEDLPQLCLAIQPPSHQSAYERIRALTEHSDLC